MKSYEQMTQDVLKRRDEELRSSDKFSKAAKVIVPCVSAVAGVAVIFGAGVIAKNFVPLHSQNWLNTSGAANSANSTEVFWIGSNSSNETADISPETPSKLDFTNPNAGQTSDEINIIVVDKFNLEQSASLGESVFTEYSMQQLYSTYGIEFDRLTKLHSDWTESHDRLGVYKRYFEDDFSVGMEMVSTRNTLNYTTDTGAKITVSAQIRSFDPISDTVNKLLAEDKPYTPTLPKNINEYDEKGNLIAQISPGYDPTKDPNRPTDDDGVNLMNGYKMYMYREDGSGRLAADIRIGGTRVRFTAEGLTVQEFCDIIDEYTR